MVYSINTISDYPDNGKHMECEISLPFDIRKGEDAYEYTIKGISKMYNVFKSETKIDDRWIVHLKEQSNESLEKIFEIKLNKDLYVILSYCKKIYIKSLKMEIKRIQLDLKKINDEEVGLEVAIL